MAGLSTWRLWLFFSSLFLARCFADDGLLNNGDFETAPPDGFPNTGVGEGQVSLPGWSLNGTIELIALGQKQGEMILVVPQAANSMWTWYKNSQGGTTTKVLSKMMKKSLSSQEDRLGNDAEVSQDIKVEKGSTYSITFSAARTCAQLESLNISMPPASQTIDLQTLYSVDGWNSYALAFQAESDDARVVFKNPGMEEDPTCGPILDNVAIKKLFIPDKPKDNAVINGDFEEGPWMFKNASLGVLLPTNLDEETSSLPGWIIESNRAVRYVDSDHYSVPQGKRGVELLSGKEGIISQMVETTPNKQYSLTFSLGDAGDSCKKPLAIMAFAGDQAEAIHFSPTGNMTYHNANVTFTAKAERTRVAFYSVYYNTRTDDKSSLCGPVVDDVTVWGVSGSPKVLGGLGLGLLGMVLALALA